MYDNDRWDCPSCTFNNHADLLTCEICDCSSLIRRDSIYLKNIQTIKNYNNHHNTLINPLSSSSSSSIPKKVTSSTSSSSSSTSSSSSSSSSSSLLPTESTSNRATKDMYHLIFDTTIPLEYARTNLNATSGIFQYLTNILIKCKDKYKLSYPDTIHISQKQTLYGTKWSCGYRNIQMLYASLIQIPKYQELFIQKLNTSKKLKYYHYYHYNYFYHYNNHNMYIVIIIIYFY